jgi:hypothetical protein
MRFAKILLVCCGSMLFARLSAHQACATAATGTLIKPFVVESAGGLQALSTPLKTDAGRPLPLQTMADGGAPLPPPTAADGGAPLPPPTAVDGGAPLPPPTSASAELGSAV